MDLPKDESLRWVVSRYASLRVENAEGIGDPALVQPTPEDFPDAFELSTSGVGRFLARMLEYAPVASDLDVRLRVVEGEAAEGSGGGGCGTKACGSPGAGAACGTRPQSLGDRVVDLDDAYIVEISASAAGHPLRLAAALARSVGTIVLLEAGEEFEAGAGSGASAGPGISPSEIGPVSEVAAAAVGFGVLLLGGAYLFGKSCGGVRVEQCTHLDVMELAVALALFTRLHGHKPSRARAHLEVTQREAFGEALAWVDSNDELVTRLLRQPELLANGVFEVRPTQGILGRWLSRARSKDAKDGRAELRDPLGSGGAAQGTRASRGAPRSAEEQRRIDQARELVDAALGGGTAGSVE